MLVHASESDFQDSLNVSIRVAEGFDIALWAPGPLLSNAVAISMDHQGAAYVSSTQRRKSSDLDIRSHRYWMTSDLSLQTLEDTEAFHLDQLAIENSAKNTWLEDFDGNGSRDYRDLTVQSERIFKIWDSNGDGRADVSALFAEGFNEMLTGVAAGILYSQGDIFLTAAPNVYRLNDIDGDGDEDQREIISRGYGIHIAYAGHDMSGLVKGPDGKIYWSIGDIGVNVEAEGKRFAYPNQGAVMRCNPDGSEFEVFAHGLRNPQELAFDKYGNLISVDNDGDHPGEHERFVHILEGSDSGWRINWQFGKYKLENEEYKVWMDEKLHVPHFDGQAAYLLPPLALAPDGPAGLVYQPGTALNKQWEDFFFGSYFKGSAAKSQIQAFKLKPKGASFEVAETRDVVSGIVSTGLAVGPDGAIYINDWLESYDKKPIGRIWKLDVSDTDQQQRIETQRILADGMKSRSNQELKTLLAHDDMRVRLEAQFDLVKRQSRADFMEVLSNSQHEMAMIHSVWGLGQLARKDPSVGDDLLPHLAHGNPEIQIQVAKVLGDARFIEASEMLLELLEHPSSRVKLHAAEALGKIQEKKAFHPLVDLIKTTGESDPHLRHALIYALSKLAIESELEELASNESPAVRIGAVVALRRMRSPALSIFLNDTDSLVLIETARAIHDDQSVSQALPALAQSLLDGKTHNEAFIRRAINANLRTGDAASASRLATYSKLADAPKKMKIDALWALGYWENPPLLDRVEGRYRKLTIDHSEAGVEAFEVVAMDLLNEKDLEIRAAAIQAVGRLKYQNAEDLLVDFSLQRSQPLSIRRASLKSLAMLESTSLERVIRVCLEDPQLALRTDAQDLMASVDLPASFVVNMISKTLESSSIAEKQKVLSSLAKISEPEAESLMGRLLSDLINGNLELGLQLDLIKAIENSSFTDLQQKLSTFQSGRESEPVIDRYRETLAGGNPQNGRQLFYNDNSAQCIRCHKLGNAGGDVGPNLDGIANVLNAKELLLALIEPSDRLAPGYGTVNLELTDGSTVVGVTAAETQDFVQLTTSDGRSQSYSTDQITKKSYLPSSMPTMQSVLTKTEIRDLVAFLLEQKSDPIAN